MGLDASKMLQPNKEMATVASRTSGVPGGDCLDPDKLNLSHDEQLTFGPCPGDEH